MTVPCEQESKGDWCTPSTAGVVLAIAPCFWLHPEQATTGDEEVEEMTCVKLDEIAVEAR